MNHTGKDDHINVKLRELRRARGLTVGTLAKKIDEDSQKVGRIERGVRSITLDYLVKVAKALETPVESFLENEKKEKVNEIPVPDFNLLSDLVLLIEEYYKKAPMKAHKKAVMVSKIYEEALKFPKDHQKMFLTSLFEVLNFVEL